MPQSSRRLSPLPVEKILSRVKILHPLTFALALLFSFLFAGCGKSGRSGEISWEGKLATVEREIPNPSLVQLQEAGFAFTPDLLPKRFLQLNEGSGIRLLQFSNETEAYAAFQKIANGEELSLGFAFQKGKTFFRKGAWLGFIGTSTDEDGKQLQTQLDLPANEDWGALPKIYGSFLQQGRIPHSERVLLNRFLGLAISKPVFSAQFDCHGDSAAVYLSPETPSQFSTEVKSLPGFRMESGVVGGFILFSDSGWLQPIRLDFSSRGMVGVEGCFDSSLTSNWIKTQKIALNNLKI